MAAARLLLIPNSCNSVQSILRIPHICHLHLEIVELMVEKCIWQNMSIITQHFIIFVLVLNTLHLNYLHKRPKLRSLKYSTENSEPYWIVSVEFHSAVWIKHPKLSTWHRQSLICAGLLTVFHSGSLCWLLWVQKRSLYNWWFLWAKQT